MQNSLTMHAIEINNYLEKLKISDVTIKIGISDELNNHKNDCYFIYFQDNYGHIYGKNSISVLNGVYRFLYECGIRWIRPGIDGEYIPSIKNIPSIDLFSEASFGHRGVCIEGAVSVEHVQNMVDWIPKIGMNSYMTQFRQSHTFFDRWYSHQQNNSVEKEYITIAQADEYISKIVKDIKSRGMIYHAVGHGWTCEPFGYSGLGWDQVDYEPKKEDLIHLALVNGKRDFWDKRPIDTNLCYSNKDTRDIINKDILKYLKAHPDIDVLHFWLADATNNNCECPECVKMRPSDYYVIMLNELDRLLSANNIDTKIVFLIYVDLLWAPQYNTLENPDRFIIMFAPITRSYAHSFLESKPTDSLPDFVRNKLDFPKSIDENLEYYNIWYKDFQGDSFIFDYHLMWYFEKDQSLMNISKVISNDIKAYKKLHLNGLISCQVQRIFLPTALPMYIMGMTLWNENLSYEEIEIDYFISAFGDNWKLAKEYLDKLSESFDPEIIESKNFDKTDGFIKAADLINNFIETAKENIKSHDNLCHTKSWEYLLIHARLCNELSETIIAYSNKDIEKHHCHSQAVIKIAEEIDIKHSNVFEILGFMQEYNRILKLK